MASKPDLKKSYIHISTFEQLDNTFLDNPDRNLYFEIYWIKEESPLHFIDNEKMNIKGDWMYLVPPFRNYSVKKADKSGILIAFDKDLLIYEAKEFSLTIFQLFSRHGDFSTIFIDEGTSETLSAILAVLKTEYSQQAGNLLLLRTLLKAFLLKLMVSSEQHPISPDFNEKRVYPFLLLLENHYTAEKKVGFYAEKLSLSCPQSA